MSPISWVFKLLLIALSRLPALLTTLAIAVIIRYAAALAIDWTFPDHTDQAAARKRERTARILAISATISSQITPSSVDSQQRQPDVRFASAYAALKALITQITATFVRPWYSLLSPSPAFPMALEVTLLDVSITLASRFERTNIPGLCASRLLPKITHHFDEYRKLEHLLNPLTRHPTAAPDPATVLQSHHKHLHPALPPSTLSNPLQSIEAYLRSRIVDPLLKTLLPPEERTDVVLALAREIITCSILVPLVDMLSEPDFWNQYISDKLRQAIESASLAAPHPDTRPHTSPIETTISAHTSPRTFDAFLNSINKVGNLAEAKRLRSDIDREIRTLRSSDHPPVTDEERRREEAHLKRLERARRRIDKRIERISGKSSVAGRETNGISPLMSHATPTSTPEPSLRQILDNPSSLVLLTEFMDRRGQSNVVQFWLAVNSFQMPLDDVDDDAFSLPTPGAPATAEIHLPDCEIAYEDICLLWTRFIRPSQGALGETIGTANICTVERVATTPKQDLSPADITAAQHSAFRAQRDAYRFMLEQCFPPFRRTELYRKAAMDAYMHDGRMNVPSMVRHDGQSLTAPPTPLKDPSPKWMSLSTHFPSFSKAKSSMDEAIEIAAQDTTIEDDNQVTPKRPTAARQGRARRISNAINSMRSPNGRDPRDVPPALGFLIGSPDEDGRKGIFDEGEDDGVTESVGADLYDQPEKSDDYVEIQRMEAIQAALTSIMERDAMSRHTPRRVDRRHSGHSLTAQRSASSLSVSLIDRPPLFDPLGAARQSFDNDGYLARPALTRGSLSQASPAMGISPTDNARRRDRVFDDGDNDDEESLAGSIDLASPSPSSRKPSGVFEAPDMSACIDPGNTEIGTEIEWMADRLKHLREQDAILNKMIRAADLKGSTGQLKLLVTSQNDLKLEIQALILQKQQYEQLQQNSMIHPNRTSIKIPTAAILAQEAGKQIVRYRIDVEQRANDGSTLIRWSVPRRFNEFYDLHQTLKSDTRLASELRARNIDLPAKKLLPKLSEAFVNSRRVALEKYLVNLLEIPLACGHIALRQFLSQSTAAFSKKFTNKRVSVAQQTAPHANVITPAQSQSFYQSFTSSIDDVFTRPSMLEVVSENLGKQAGNMVDKWDAGVVQAGQLGLEWGSSMLSPVLNPIVAGFGETGYPFGTMLGNADGVTKTTSDPQSTFIGPICDFLMQLLDYKDNDWLRRPALLVILQHFMGSTIERKIRESCDSALSAQAAEKYIAMIQDTMWPNGERRSPSEPRTEDQKLRTKHSAASKIQALIPSPSSDLSSMKTL
ncbi:hypothetical protein QFC22_003565 [Naganishia vaughanmartiniae]|uniref:Uncharacterized protein n=1 Tax=Naganishia vaughanmartiniae TaxID=1424756 RepID=A0ACC2X6Q0_9TREE|nr:hypothetical protein QFC22_003565 [Naganishia vaughanmartiniae]